MKKADLDNRSRQLNPTDPTYWSARGVQPPAVPLVPPAEPAPAATSNAEKK